jgi:hypothetical protein
VDRGQTFRVVSAVLLDGAIDDTYFFVVQFDNPLDPTLPVHLPLNADIATPDGKLNPMYFQPLR